MSVFGQLSSKVSAYLPALIITIVVLVALRLIQWLWLSKKFNAFSDHKIIPQVLMIVFGIIGVILIILALPVSDNLRGQILSLLGLVVTGVMALSSATFVSNAFGGSMLRLTRSFRVGDYIRVGDIGGRVSDRGIFHTEIQTEDRDLTTFPNLYLITNPVTVVRASGTIISATISLGYDVHHSRVEELLIQAAQSADLDDPYVHVIELGDFSITYKISGFLGDIKILITARSRLKKAILDALHGAGVEIVSPTFVNQRVQKERVLFIPDRVAAPSAPTVVEEKTVEAIAFDKAEEAEEEAIKQQTNQTREEAKSPDEEPPAKQDA